VEVDSTTNQLPELGLFFLGEQPLGHGAILLPAGRKSDTALPASVLPAERSA